jgi:hypothetical protein
MQLLGKKGIQMKGVIIIDKTNSEVPGGKKNLL